MTIKIGTWHEKEARDVVQHTSYAADAINVRTKPGDYDLKISFKTGYSVPMPDQLHGAIDAEVTGGGYYSGFGGVNHGFTPAKLGSTTETVQSYSYQLASLIESGIVTIKPEWLWLTEDIPWKSKEAPADWDELKKMKELSEYWEMLATQDPEKSLEQGGEFPIASETSDENRKITRVESKSGRVIDAPIEFRENKITGRMEYLGYCKYLGRRVAIAQANAIVHTAPKPEPLKLSGNVGPTAPLTRRDDPLTDVEGLIEADEALGKAIDEAVVALSEQRNNLEHSSKPFFGSDVYSAVQEIRGHIAATERLLKRLAD